MTEGEEEGEEEEEEEGLGETTTRTKYKTIVILWCCSRYDGEHLKCIE